MSEYTQQKAIKVCGFCSAALYYRHVSGEILCYSRIDSGMNQEKD